MVSKQLDKAMPLAGNDELTMRRVRPCLQLLFTAMFAPANDVVVTRCPVMIHITYITLEELHYICFKLCLPKARPQ